MKITVGDTLVYPHHGAVTVTGQQTRTVRGAATDYVTLRVHTSDLTIELPAANFDLVGVRNVIDAQGVDDVYRILRSEYVDDHTNWSRRFKANQEKMASGSILKMAEVIRDLSARDSANGLSAGEKRLLQKARLILDSELALALDCTMPEATAAADAVLTEQTRRTVVEHTFLS